MDDFGLTDRELEMLKLHAVLTLGGVAAETGTAVQTVKNTLNRAYAKLGVGGGSEGGSMPRERAMIKLGWLKVPE